MVTNICLRGYLVGPIWQAGLECYKPLAYSITQEAKRYLAPPTLREHVLAATKDGDFQFCTIAHGRLVVTRQKGRRRVTREFPLAHFPSARNYLHPEGDEWFPPDEED